MNKIKAALAAAWEHLDAKLKYTVITAAVTYLLTKGAIQLDANVSALVSGAVASLVGYRVENDASVVRRENELDDEVPLPLPPKLLAADQDPLAGVDVAKLK